ncbi:tyrosine-protein phosphatase Lar-like isoform X5 [Portunus trituberculatus]|uniref:tyrosine-protein phosphatase Lar-like isoform X5 n=1 Tax=Portunus trituberculatus TaxID=210409 RepID=UPI001E1D1DA9|nr:tyrosine-protein phosphatase Lar-like isoform X5 [Portunus trituberculatus]
MNPNKAGSRMRPGAPCAGSVPAPPLLTPFLLLLLAVVCTAVSATAATADTTNSNSTAEGDPGGGEDDTISLPDKVFPFIEFNTHPPQFEERPRDQRVMSDRVASFTCRATGSPEPKIQWRKNNRRINGNSRLIVVQVPGGSILRIEPVKYQRDEAVYECVVENAAGDTIKASAKLEVLSDDPGSIPNGFPYFRTEPKTKAVEIDHTALLVCDARGNPEPTITWYKDHQPVDLTNPRYTVLRSGSLQISTSTEEDGGKYECVAENTEGTAFSNLVSLYVRVRRVPPRFSMAPESVYEVMPGASLSITCVAVGSPMPYVQWKKDMTVEMTENLITKNVLQLDNIQESANYTCQAQSTLGLVTKDVSVKVQALPRPPDSVRISDIMSTSVRVTWSYDVSPGDVSYYVLQYKPRHADRDYAEISGLVTKFYTVINLTPFTDYEFQVLAVNKIGRGPASEPAYVTTGETEPGSAPRNVHVRPLSSSTMVIQWDEPETPNGQITGYKLYYTTNPSLPIQSWKSQPVQDNKLTTISDLTPHTIYTIRVQAYTGIGPGPLSDPVKVKTQQGVPSQPTNLHPSRVTATSIELSWTRPSHQGENIISYELYWNDSTTSKQEQRNIPEGESYTLEDLQPNTVYSLWLAARSQRGEGAATAPTSVRTDQDTPGSPPNDIRANAEDSESIRVEWKPPPLDKQHGDITYYKLMIVNNSRPDSDASLITISDPNQFEYLITNLKKWTEYRVWMLAGTVIGDGLKSEALLVRTDEDGQMPGEPRNVKVEVINSTSIEVTWTPPDEKERHGIIRGYQIHVQNMNRGNDNTNPGQIPHTIHNGEATRYVVGGLTPDTKYQVQVSAITRKGDGTRSTHVTVEMPGGVPNKPALLVNGTVNGFNGELVVNVEWSPPTETYGEIKGYRLRYGPRGEQLETITLEGASMLKKTLNDLQRGIEYEIRVAGRNHINYGQEAVKFYVTPEAAPSGPPTNITYRFQTPGTIVFTWDLPSTNKRNGVITLYDLQFSKNVILNNDFKHDKNISDGTRIVFTGLEENMDYTFKVRAWTSMGAGPYSETLHLHTEPDLVRAPMNLQGMATSDSSIEIWWEPVPSRGKVIGYQVFYTMSPVPDLDLWDEIKVAVTHSAELQNLERHAEYAIAVAARTSSSNLPLQGLGRLSTLKEICVKPVDVPMHLRAHDVTTHSANLTWGPPIQLNPLHFKITYSAVKEFVDAQGVTQVQKIPTVPRIVSNRKFSYVIEELRPFTTYTVNVTAVPQTSEYRPPAKITVTTQMAAPQPMVKPDFYGVKGNHEIAMILPQASEEYGPIAFYYLIVVPEDKLNSFKNPDQYLTDDLIANKAGSKEALAEGPYIAAKFLQRNIPYSFSLGNGEIYEGFKNRPLQKKKRYKIFVRAVVDAPGQHLYTSSPFSAYISLDMRPAPFGKLPERPNPYAPTDESNNYVEVDKNDMEMLMIVGPVIGAVLVVVISLFLFLFVWKRRRQPKSPDQAQVTKPLMADLGGGHGGGGVGGGGGGGVGIIPAAPLDPVEMRRLNFQTPGMISHPPIPISQLAEHIERLKTNDNQKFSQEYESIDPGQQFTWENSNLEINKPKNRYANVIAYDHSRVVLQTLEGVSGSDYINANFCDGYRKQNAYIATQGPLPETFGDLWRMLWEQRSSTIVMMTKLEERTRIKCDQYWPARVAATETYGIMHVTLTEVQELATFTLRTFQLQKSGSLDRREIRQFQFTAWPDHGVPDHPSPFLMFLRRVRHMNPADAGPIVVHCSAGVGRTGAFIVIDAMLERIKHERTVDIYGHVTCLRAQRNYMVQTEDQYIFIHDALLEAVIAGVTEVPARNLHGHIQKLMAVEPGENVTGMELEFKRLANIKAQPSRFVSANLPVNKFKNRLVNILPFEGSRVCLQPLRGTEGSDYINASFIDGYRYRYAYIATQGPLQETVDDFWRMLWEHNSTIVVMLTKLKEMGREKCYQYWPNERSQRYQFYVVDPIAEYNMPQYILREFKITDARDGQSHTIRQFQFIEWPEQGVPKSGEGFIDFIGQVHKTKEQFGQDGPITVHCSAGVGRTGVFITLSQVLERMQYEGVVDLFQTVRNLRTQRPAMVQTEEEYRFCYLAALEYLDSFDHLVD